MFDILSLLIVVLHKYNDLFLFLLLIKKVYNYNCLINNSLVDEKIK